MKPFVCVLAVACLLGAPDAPAETVRALSAATTYDSNLFGTSTDGDEVLTELSTTFALRSGRNGNDRRLFYTGAAYLFGRSPDRSFSVHEVGLSGTWKLGPGRNRLFAGASSGVRLDRALYTLYDYASFRGHVGARWYPADDLMLRIGYHLDARSYWNLDASGYADHVVYAQASRFLASRTTLRADASYNAKRHGRSEGQVVLGAQVAQSLAEGTGLSARIQRRINTRGAGSLVEAVLNADEDLLVDRYDYSGQAWTLRLTQQLPLRSRAILSGGTETQHYAGQVVVTGSGALAGATRRDRIHYGEAEVEMPVSRSFQVDLIYRLERSTSSDAYYDYGGRQAVGASLGVRF